MILRVEKCQSRTTTARRSLCRSSVLRLAGRRRRPQSSGFRPEARVVECLCWLMRRLVVAELNTQFDVLADGVRIDHAFWDDITVACLRTRACLLFLPHDERDRFLSV